MNDYTPYPVMVVHPGIDRAYPVGTRSETRLHDLAVTYPDRIYFFRDES